MYIYFGMEGAGEREGQGMLGAWQIGRVGVEEQGGRGARTRRGGRSVRPAWTGGNGGAVVVENLRSGEAKSGGK